MEIDMHNPVIISNSGSNFHPFPSISADKKLNGKPVHWYALYISYTNKLCSQ
jgi:hypothetical protein